MWVTPVFWTEEVLLWTPLKDETCVWPNTEDGCTEWAVCRCIQHGKQLKTVFGKCFPHSALSFHMYMDKQIKPHSWCGNGWTIQSKANTHSRQWYCLLLTFQVSISYQLGISSLRQPVSIAQLNSSPNLAPFAVQQFHFISYLAIWRKPAMATGKQLWLACFPLVEARSTGLTWWLWEGNCLLGGGWLVGFLVWGCSGVFFCNRQGLQG